MSEFENMMQTEFGEHLSYFTLKPESIHLENNINFNILLVH